MKKNPLQSKELSLHISARSKWAVVFLAEKKERYGFKRRLKEICNLHISFCLQPLGPFFLPLLIDVFLFFPLHRFNLVEVDESV